MLVVNSPKDLKDFTVKDLPSLEFTEGYKKNLDKLNSWISRISGLHTARQVDGSGGSPPRAHQVRHAVIASLRNYNFLCWNMGTGKTLTSLLIMLITYGDYLFSGIDWKAYNNSSHFEKELFLYLARISTSLKPGTIQIAAPRHILNQVWMKELNRIGLSRFSEVITSQSQLLNSKAPIFVYDHDFCKAQTDKGSGLRKNKEGIRIVGNGKLKFVGHRMAKLIAKKRPPSFLIVDEIHKLRPDTERTECMRIIRRKAKRVLGLTGTPMDGWIEHSAAILAFIYREESNLFPYTVENFSKRFTKTKSVNTDILTGSESVTKEKAMPGVNEIQIPAFIEATQHLIHRLNLGDEEVKANVKYPEVRDHILTLDLELSHAEEYKSLASINKSKIKEELSLETALFLKRDNILKLINQLRQISKAPTKTPFRETTHGKAIIKIVSEMKANGRKGLIGTTFISESREIHQMLQEEGLKGVRLYVRDEALSSKKDMTPLQREELIETFQEDSEYCYLVCNKQLVAEGLNLSETCSYTLCVSQGWRANIESQWLFRVVRPGQQYPWVDCFTLINNNTIDKYIDELIKAKLKASANVIDLDFSDEIEMVELDPMVLAKRLCKDST